MPTSTHSKALQDAEEKIRYWAEFKKLGLAPLNQEDFFPAVAYPPVTRYPRAASEELLTGYVFSSDYNYDIYIDIPFCDRHCTFCHLPVWIRPSPVEIDRYLNALEKEMDLFLRKSGLEKIKVRSILLGGGTPTYLLPEQLERFLKFFTARLDMSEKTQFSVDLDPKTMIGEHGKKRLEIMRTYGVNRLTIGINSLDDGILKKMNRPHTAQDAADSVRMGKAMEFLVNIEFMFGYPTQTMDGWIETMERAIALEADEIQLYRLKIVPSTNPYEDRVGAIARQFQVHPDQFLTAEDTLRMKQVAHSLLHEKGYEERLIRVFSKDPKIFSHYAESLCCTLRNIIGFGHIAWTCLEDRIGINALASEEYHSLIEQGKLPIYRGKIRTPDEQLRWALVLPLRSREVRKEIFQLQTGRSLDGVFRNKIERLKKLGLLQEDEKELSLTRLGRFFADEVCYQFYHPQYIPFPREDFAEGEMNPYNDAEP